MKLEKITKRLKCDIGGCKSMAEYSVSHERGNLRNRLNICGECMKEMYELFGKCVTPESLPSMFTKKTKRGGKGVEPRKV